MSETFIPEFLGGEPLSETPAAEAAPAAEAPQAGAEPAPAADAPAAEPQGQARGPDGKFASALAPVSEAAPAAPAPVAEAPVVAPAAPAPEPAHHIPIAAHLDERDRRQKAEDRAEAAEKRAAELERQQQQEAAAKRQPPPDPEKDPIGHLNYLRQQDRAFLEAQSYDQKLDLSRRFAESSHGKEAVEKASAWFGERASSDPLFNRKVEQSRDPYELVVNEWKREQTLSQLGNDPKRVEAFLAWEAAQKTDPAAQAPAAAAAPATPTPPAAAPAAAPVAPRPSLAAAPAAGATGADTRIADGEEVFQGMFSR